MVIAATLVSGDAYLLHFRQLPAFGALRLLTGDDAPQRLYSAGERLVLRKAEPQGVDWGGTPSPLRV